MSYAAHASQLLEELESGWLEVCKCPSNQGGYIRVPVSVNSEWYRKFCAQFEQRRRKYPKPRTIIKRCHVIRALRKIIAGVESDGVYVGRLMDCIERSTANMAQRELTIDREFSSLNGPLTEEERGTGMSAIYARLKWDAGGFIHRNGSLLASVQISEGWTQALRVNLYPGVVRWRGFSPGIYLGARNSDVIVGLSLTTIPLGLAVSQ